MIIHDASSCLETLPPEKSLFVASVIAHRILSACNDTVIFTRSIFPACDIGHSNLLRWKRRCRNGSRIENSYRDKGKGTVQSEEDIRRLFLLAVRFLHGPVSV